MTSATPPCSVARLAGLAAFALAMALVEAAIVVYLRDIYYGDDPLRIFPLRPLSEAHLRLELVREAATVVMLLAVAVLAVRGGARRCAAFAFLFGLWDPGHEGQFWA